MNALVIQLSFIENGIENEELAFKATFGARHIGRGDYGHTHFGWPWAE